jgi:hypothetical protein
MSAALQRFEVLQRNAAIGMRFWDLATATSAIDGLVVEVFPRANPNARRRAWPNPSAVYVAHSVSGLRSFEFDGADAPEQPWTNAAQSPMRGYRVEVRDPHGRFLPLAFDADLPIRGLLNTAAPALAGVLSGDTGSPPLFVTPRVPLFSAPSRPPPQPLAVVYAQFREQGSLRIPAWAVLGVAIDDADGNVAVMFPYPEPPRVPLASPPEARSDFRWTVELTAYGPPSLPSPPPPTLAQIPDLADVLAQLATPRTVVASVESPALPLRLDYRVPLTARTAGLPAAEASYLLLAPA